MRILVADDSESERQLLSSYLDAEGHSVVEAQDGQEAVRISAGEHFDLVLMDSIMPNMVGNEAVRQIRKRDRELNRFTPVLFISSLNDPSEMVASLAFGGDDYLVKPVNMHVLSAKVRVFERIATQHRKLEDYRRSTEDDKTFAVEVLEHLTRSRSDFGAQIRHATHAYDRLPGDLFATSSCGDDQIVHLLLSDAMGHSLPASLTTVLLAQSFYRFTETDRPLAELAADLNTELKRLLPPGFFIATALARIEIPKRRIEVWNGGIPLVQFRDDRGRCTAFPSRHPSLGVLSPESFDGATVDFVSERPGELLLATDGLTESAGDLLASTALDYDLLLPRLNGASAHDDATIAAYRLD